jgi:hypothetical protein
MKARTSASASIHQGGELGDLGSELIGHLAPLGAGHFGIFLGKGGGDEGARHAGPACRHAPGHCA